ncbi:MAG: hypothetical protein QGF29_12120, partial [Verrucomicrobiota bacterium]|nr:hypothetical protein [Verrucomicrobiota bacterium]
MDAALEALHVDIHSAGAIENGLRRRPAASKKNGRLKKVEAPKIRPVEELLAESVGACRTSRKRHQEEMDEVDFSDAG